MQRAAGGCRTAAACVMALLLAAAPGGLIGRTFAAVKGWPADVVEVEIPSSADGKLQKALFWAPAGAKVDAEYRKRSPLQSLEKARGLAILVGAGIHDGHEGSVPVSHALRAFNALARANGLKGSVLSQEAIDAMVRTQRVPVALQGAQGPAGGARDASSASGSKEVLFERSAGPVRVMVFQGGHEADVPAGFAWLEAHRKAKPRKAAGGGRGS